MEKSGGEKFVVNVKSLRKTETIVFIILMEKRNT
jgi:hypothetical protein